MTRYISKEMVVNNHFRESNPLSWANAFCACTVESAAIFDHKKKLINFNNRFGTLDDASDSDLIDILSLFRYYSRFYSNAADCLSVLKNVFVGRSPVSFTMYHYYGWTCDCRAYPVLDDMRLTGVVLLGHRSEIGAALQVAKPSCEQPFQGQ